MADRQWPYTDLAGLALVQVAPDPLHLEAELEVAQVPAFRQAAEQVEQVEQEQEQGQEQGGTVVGKEPRARCNGKEKEERKEKREKRRPKCK